MPLPSFAQFQAAARAHGAQDVLVRRWNPGQVLETHSHPFEAQAIVTEGEMWLTCGGETRHLLPGGEFHLPAHVPHSERYGPQGATYWVARRVPV